MNFALTNLKASLVRHRVKILDLGFIAVALAVAAVFAFEVDVFKTENQVSRQEETVELDEALLLASLAMGGALFYTWRRAHEHQRENRRRLEAEQEVMVLALQDPLTGLPNRRQFDEAVKLALNTIPAAPEAHAILLLDLNGFKKVNDVHGHPAGDQVLVHVGARLLRAVRDGDLVARIGGDEFAILARNIAGAEGATSVALRILDALAVPVSAAGVRHAVGGAIGIVMAPNDGTTAEDLIRKADVALYRAKAESKSALRFFEPAMDARLQERDALERALRSSVERDDFVLRFQPTRAADDRIIGFEAQPRWPHPTLDEIGPERFLPLAEDAGLLGLLTEQLLRKACDAAATWPGDVRLSFTLPSGLLADPAFGLRILSVLAKARLQPSRLSLEVDEGALIRDTEAAQAMLAPLRGAGIAITANHFGTGYSDLHNLHRLKLDGIKIDPSFVSAMTHDRQAAVIVKALIGIGQGLDLTVVADGVGTRQQKAVLAAQGCDLGQGALHGEALDADRALALVAPKPVRTRKAG